MINVKFSVLPVVEVLIWYFYPGVFSCRYSGKCLFHVQLEHVCQRLPIFNVFVLFIQGYPVAVKAERICLRTA